MKRRHVTCERAGICPKCRTKFEVGARITPDDGMWICESCDGESDDLDALLRWMAYYYSVRRIPPLDHEDAVLLGTALNHAGIEPARRGGRDTWHIRTSRYAWLQHPFAEDAYGLLVDAVDDQFVPRMPAPGISAILDALDT
ncbi:hypothetical protein GCM10009724_26520 [Microbacterium lacticum]|nr:hypothetical protein MLA01_26190 [Microbacterium lacticum]GGI74201.1 hypothetical protein GCM10009724_26520 [Microbacterium lacticum]